MSFLDKTISSNAILDFAGIFLYIIIFSVYVAVAVLIAAYVGKTARKNNCSFVAWFILGIFFGFYALIPLHIAIKASRANRSFTGWAIFGFIGSVLTLITLETGLIATKKKLDFTTYCILGFVFNIFALIAVSVYPIQTTNVDNNTALSKTAFIEKNEPTKIVMPTAEAPVKQEVQLTTLEPIIKKEPTPPTEANTLQENPPQPDTTNIENVYWTCPKCKRINFKTREVCLNCKTPKPD